MGRSKKLTRRRFKSLPKAKQGSIVRLLEAEMKVAAAKIARFKAELDQLQAQLDDKETRDE